MDALYGDLRPLSANCAQSSSIVHISGLLSEKTPPVQKPDAQHMLLSGKEKAHKCKQICPVTARAGGGFSRPGGGGVSRPVARGQKFMCCVRNPRKINVFVRVPGREESGSRPGGSVTEVTEKLFVCQMFMCLFWPLFTAQGGTRRCWGPFVNGNFVANDDNNYSCKRGQLTTSTLISPNLRAPNLDIPDACHRRKFHLKKSTPNKQVLARVTGKKAKGSSELFEKVRVNTFFFFGISGFWVGFWASSMNRV